jgi:hypothetical protein
MPDVNWWLMALAFFLGLVLTLFSIVDRPRNDVPRDQPTVEGQ